jgi:hypothetical protein
MSELPLWYPQLKWSQPHLVATIAQKDLPLGAGLYVFTRDGNIGLSDRNVLYVGKADGAGQTLQTRVGVYLRCLRSKSDKLPRHAGLRDLVAYGRASAGALFLRWAGVVVGRELEGRLIQLFDPPFNHKEEHRIGYMDDELIPEFYLYEP